MDDALRLQKCAERVRGTKAPMAGEPRATVRRRYCACCEVAAIRRCARSRNHTRWDGGFRKFKFNAFAKPSVRGGGNQRVCNGMHCERDPILHSNLAHQLGDVGLDRALPDA